VSPEGKAANVPGEQFFIKAASIHISVKQRDLKSKQYSLEQRKIVLATNIAETSLCFMVPPFVFQPAGRDRPTRLRVILAL
jgi:hypothetical protein